MSERERGGRKQYNHGRIERKRGFYIVNKRRKKEFACFLFRRLLLLAVAKKVGDFLCSFRGKYSKTY